MELALERLLVDSGAYELADRYWGEGRDLIRYEITDDDGYYGKADGGSVVQPPPRIFVSMKVLRSMLAINPDCLCALLLHEVGHLDHMYRIVNGRAAKSDLGNEDLLEAVADDFVVAAGLRDALIKGLEITEAQAIGDGRENGSSSRRLRRLRPVD